MCEALSIHEAAENGQVEQVAQLLDQNPDLLEVKSEDGWTPLHTAVFASEFEVVRLLLSRGANVNSRDERGWTPLQEATYNSTVEMARLLVEHGAEVNTRDQQYGLTPLHYAVVDGFADVVAFLMESGADTEARDSSGKTPLVWAKELSNTAVAALLQNRQ